MTVTAMTRPADAVVLDWGQYDYPDWPVVSVSRIDDPGAAACRTRTRRLRGRRHSGRGRVRTTGDFVDEVKAHVGPISPHVQAQAGLFEPGSLELDLVWQKLSRKGGRRVYRGLRLHR